MPLSLVDYFKPHQATTFLCGFDGMSEVYNISILRGRSSRDKATTYLQSHFKQHKQEQSKD